MTDPHRRSFTIVFKRTVVQHFDITKSNRKTALNLGVPRTAFIKWFKNREKIIEKSQKCGFRRIKTNQTVQLYEWFRLRREEQIGVTCYYVKIN